ncbi:MAG TPA: hypothetical protein VGR37_17535 [Longimicrobiaceae bacterium]|nr:hypothetical protein [Longimicrobiaceae bacterium]
MSDDTIARLAQAELGDDARAALPFLEAAAGQLAAPLRVGGRTPAPGELRVAAECVLRLLRLAASPEEAGGGPEAAGARLAADPLLASVLFQNVDLLYEAGFRHADAVSLAVVHALGPLGGAGAG